MLGLGRAGQAATAALAARFGVARVRAWDDSRGDRLRPLRASAAATGIPIAADPEAALEGVRTVVKSPGVDLDHPLVRAASERGLVIIDELELGWRLAAGPSVGVTGTNGKSTTAALIVAALRASGADPLLCANTLHGPPLSAASDHAGWLVAEVSSYQLECCPELVPSAAVLTNLTRDHLHRHDSMDAYAAAKRRLFVRGDRTVPLAVLNGDDAFGLELAEGVRDRGGRALTYALEAEADYRIRDCSWSLRGAVIEVTAPDGEVGVETRLPGAHNAANAVAALALADGLGLAREPTLTALAATPAPPGRFEPVDAGQDFDVVVDFAHTPDGVEQALSAARAVVAQREGRLIVVLGVIARGERGVREETGRTARVTADELILCGSSLKGEPPLVALSGLLAGARRADGGMLEVVLDRRAAIARALARARRGDLVAILGRGPLVQMAHDRVGEPVSFDDREVVRELLEAAPRPGGAVSPPRSDEGRSAASGTAARA